MPNIDALIESITQQISDLVSQSTKYFSTLDLKYSYSRLNLDLETANHCNFDIKSGDMSGTYVRVELQKAMDYTLIGLKIRLDEKIFRINFPKCRLAKPEIDWFGYISGSGISLIENKTLEAPKTLKKIRSFFGSVHNINKFIPILAQISHSFCPLFYENLQNLLD